MESVDQMLTDIIRREGGYVNHAADRGGPTNMGITRKTLSFHLGRAATVAEVQELDPETAREIYRRDYLEAPRIDELPESLQPFLLDSAVNHGPGQAIKFLQRACNTCRAELDAVLEEDGIAGPATRAAVKVSGPEAGGLLRAMVEERRRFYRSIIENDPSQQTFMNGWMNRLAEFS